VTGSAQPPDAADDVATARAIAAGDEAAFARFYTRWFPACLLLARTLSRRDESYCLDIVQDVMLRVARRLPPLRDQAAVRAWMTTAVKHAITDRARADARRRSRERHRGEDEPSSPDLATLAVDGERWQWLGARLAELPAADRALLVARFSNDLSVVAAATAFGLGPDQAHGRLRRTLERLRRLAAEWWHG
jgi:RNA polymerase sigma-70 factor (ECF subfamily)